MTNETGALDFSLFGRVRAILLAPRSIWPVVATEHKAIGEIFAGYALPLALIGPVASLIGGQHDRFMVKAEGQADSIAVLKGAVDSVHAEKLEALTR